MIEEMKFNNTFLQSEIQDGDIICFQKSLTEEEYVLANYYLIPYIQFSFLYYIIIL